MSEICPSRNGAALGIAVLLCSGAMALAEPVPAPQAVSQPVLPPGHPEVSKQPQKASIKPAFDLAERAKWWSFQPIQNPPLPQFPERIAHPVDAFIREGLEKLGITPAVSASRGELLRRLKVVLHGLLPTETEYEEFAGDTAPDAYERLVDRLLASPRFGERWAQHWLDLMRYSDSYGKQFNMPNFQAWVYRDYVIRAFNDDVPYRQFLAEHLAGDFPEFDRWSPGRARHESVIGTSFFTLAAEDGDELDREEMVKKTTSSNIDVFGKAFQGLTIACAECHDHKFDAVRQADYYALKGVFESARPAGHPVESCPDLDAIKAEIGVIKKQIRSELGAVWKQDAAQAGARLQETALLVQSDSLLEPLANAVKQSKENSDLRTDKAVVSLLREKISDPDQRGRVLGALSRNRPQDILSDAFGMWSVQPGGPNGWASEEKAGADLQHLKTAWEKRSKAGTVSVHRFKSQADLTGWQVTGDGFAEGVSRPGEFALAPEGEALVTGVYPAGLYSHLISSKLGGHLISPEWDFPEKKISVDVAGEGTSAGRAVVNGFWFSDGSNNPLHFILDGVSQPEWIGIPLWKNLRPPLHDLKRGYFEIGTPDALPYAARRPSMFPTTGKQLMEIGKRAQHRAWVGIEAVSLQNVPKETLDSLPYDEAQMAALTPCRTLPEIATEQSAILGGAVDRWIRDAATDRDARMLASALRRGLLSNSSKQVPEPVGALLKRYREVEGRIPFVSSAAGVCDVHTGKDVPLYERGDHQKLGPVVPRGYLEALGMKGAFQGLPGSGRLELARHLVSPENPFTRRVVVNRIWQQLFGEGLVRSPDNFGKLGEQPTHPELLDYLATRFGEDGWSVKRLIRSLVLSETFQQSVIPEPAAREKDPDARAWSHAKRRRLDGEALRDSFLQVAGRLDLKMYGPPVATARPPTQRKAKFTYTPPEGDVFGGNRRSIYLNADKNYPYYLFGIFDRPAPSGTVGQRFVTHTPLQAFVLMNDELTHGLASDWARTLQTAGVGSGGAIQETALPGILQDLARQIFTRALEPAELQRWASEIGTLRATLPASAGGVGDPFLKELSHLFLMSNDALYY